MSLSDYDRQNGIVGRIWNKVSRAGNNFKSGFLHIGGKKLDIVIFPNKKRPDKNDPDYVIKISDPVEKRQEKRAVEIAADMFDNVPEDNDNIPF